MADYIQKFKNDLTISVGGNYNKTKTDNDTKNITYFFDPAKAPDPRPNHFIYDENIYGFYLTAEKKFSEKFPEKSGPDMRLPTVWEHLTMPLQKISKELKEIITISFLI
jgi:hypothetical protein